MQDSVFKSKTTNEEMSIVNGEGCLSSFTLGNNGLIGWRLSNPASIRRFHVPSIGSKVLEEERSMHNAKEPDLNQTKEQNGATFYHPDS